MKRSALSERRLYLLLATLALAVLVSGLALRSGLFSRPYGLERRPEARPYLAFPAKPVFTSATRWTTEPAFPNVTFKNPVVMEPEPGTKRLFIGELEGAVMAIDSGKPDTAEKTTVLDLTKQTQGGFDSGLLGLAFHPEYGRPASSNRDFVYIFYSWNPQPVMVGRPDPETVTWSRISRFKMDRATGKLRPESEQILINQRKRIIFHVGGGMFFHPQDGFLYIAVGDEGGQQDSLDNSQRIDRNLFAGVLRIDVDRRGGTVSHPIRRQPAEGETANYYIPSDNPFVGQSNALEEFYAIGLRSPHRMTYDPQDNLAWIGEIGQAAREEIEVLQIGKAPQNFQWAVKEGRGGEGEAEGGDDGAGVFPFGVGVEIEEGEKVKFLAGEAEAGAEGGGGFRGAVERDGVRHGEHGKRRLLRDGGGREIAGRPDFVVVVEGGRPGVGKLR